MRHFVNSFFTRWFLKINFSFNNECKYSVKDWNESREKRILLIFFLNLVFNFYFIAASGHPHSCEEDFTNEARTTDDVRLGDSRTTGAARSLRSSELALGFLGKSNSPGRWTSYGSHGDRGWFAEHVRLAGSLKRRQQR